VALVPFRHSVGSKSAKIALVGEAHGADEEECGKPFVGQSGRELARMAFEAGLLKNPLPDRWLSNKDMIYYWEASGLFLTNVLALRPPKNNLDALCASKKEVGNDYPMPGLRQGKYLRPEFLPELARLQEEISEVKPNLVLALGNTACWAILHSTKIGSIRGAVAQAGHQKVLPTFHPAAVLRNWALRPVVVADLLKAKTEGSFAEVRRPKRCVLVNPTLPEIEQWYEGEAKHADIISADIETGAGQIKCIGFATRPDLAIVIPFVDLTKPSGCFWDNPIDEDAAWQWVRRILALPCAKVGQNFMYDLQYLMRVGIRPCNVREDTMLLHHSLFPELQKGLGFLGSIYTQEPAWKLMARQKLQEGEKKDG
jgi:uracil-DNA glycosylase